MSTRTPTDEQKTVIDELQSNIILFASAGTGKTFSVAQRVHHIIDSAASLPSEVLCLTFTVKACQEMKDDILDYAGERGKAVTVSTIHGFCFRQLREEAKRSSSVYSEPVVYDDVDAEEALKEALKHCGFQNGDVAESKGILYPLMCRLKKERVLRGPMTSDEAADYQRIYLRLAGEDPQRMEHMLSFRHRSSGRYEPSAHLADFLSKKAGLWANCYCDTLRRENGVDFEDLVCLMHRAVKNAEIRERLRSRYRYIIVDEMQDISVMEYDIIRCLFDGNNAMMCGDYFQTIYEWRGTEPKEIIRRYMEEFRPRKIIFTKNYRSTRTLCSASFGYLLNAFPDEIDQYIDPEIKIESKTEGEKILHIRTPGVAQEAFLITEYLKKTLDPEKDDPTRVCIMSRRNSDISALYRELQQEKNRNPHPFSFFTVDEEKRFAGRKVIKDVLAVPRILLSERTDEAQLLRVSKSRLMKGVGDTLREEIYQNRTCGLSLSALVRPETRRDGDPYGELLRAAEEERIVVYDTETTGLDLGRDQIIQIAAILLDRNGEIRDSLNLLVKATVPIGKGALATHHITEAEIEKDGVTAREALEQFLAFTKDKVIVGHNSVRFDYPLIRRMLRDNGLPQLQIRAHYDTMLMAKQFLPESRNYKLATLAERFGIVNEKAHDAFGDIGATGKLLMCLIRDYAEPAAEERRMLTARYMPKFDGFAELLEELEDRYLARGDIIGLIDRIIGLYGYDHCEKTTDAAAIQELRSYIRAMPDREDASALREFLDNLNLSGSQMDALIRRLKKIPIITVHQSKGCEFDTVIIAEASDDVFPLKWSEQEGREAEERRLFYVAISRAKERLIILSVVSPDGKRQSTRYMRYIPPEYVDVKDYFPRRKE